MTITFEPYVPVAPPASTDLGQLAVAGSAFQINTFGSDFDTELGLYDAAGIIVDTNDDAIDDDGNSILQSQLEFADGLPAGEYYLALGGFNTGFGPLGFDAVPFAGSAGGDYLLNYPAGTTARVLDGETVQFFSFTVGVPEPTAAGLAGLTALFGGCLIGRRRA